MARIVGGAVGPVGGVGVSEGDVADASPVQFGDDIERVLDLMAALDALGLGAEETRTGRDAHEVIFAGHHLSADTLQRTLRSLDDEWTMKHPANLHVLRSIVSWMSRAEIKGNIQPRILATQPITLNPTTVRTTNIVFLAVLPACFMALGLCVAVLRRR